MSKLKGTENQRFGDSWKAVVWVSENRGKLSEIAKTAKVTPQFAHQVLRGIRRSKDGNVERLLREAGAPVRVTNAA